jgi:hypothetical protein
MEAQHEAEVSMRTPDLSELETIVTAAETGAPPAALDGRSTLRQTREKAAEMFADALPQLDRAELDRLRNEHDAELRRLAVEAKRRAVEGAAEAAKRLDALVAAERSVLDALPEDTWSPGSFILDEVDFIRSWPTPENLRDSHQERGENWAKYAIEDSQSGTLRGAKEKLSFYTVWQSPRDRAVLVDVLARITVNGHCACDAEWGGVASWFFPDSRSTADVSARLTLWQLWTEPAPVFPVDTVPLETVRAEGGFLGDSSGTSISVSQLVAATKFPVVAQGSILIETSLAVDYEMLSGSVDVDFASDAFSVACPYAIVTLTPEIQMSG